MVVCSWLVSLALSSPQAIMFRKVKHPNIDFCQCTSDLILEMNSEIIIKNGEPTFLFFGIDPEILYSVYQFSFLFFVYFLPLFCIIISYVVIIRLMRRWDSINSNKILFQPIFNFRRDLTSFQIDISQISARSQWKNLRMSVLQVIVFAVFWAPYVIHQSWWASLNIINEARITERKIKI